MVDESETPAGQGPASAPTADVGPLGGSLEDLHAFCAVVESGTISGAARELGETKGSISRRVSRLERRLGTVLLARTPRAVTPTEEGAAFQAKARAALSLVADAVESTRQAQSVPRGHLRVTAPLDLGLDVLPDLIARFRALHPQITIELLLTGSPLDLAAHRIDLALRATEGDLPDMEYRASTLLEFSIGLCAAPGYLAARGVPATPAELADHDLVVARESGSPAVLKLGTARGRTEELRIRPVIRTTDYASVYRLLLAGGGIGALPDIVAAAAIRAGSLQRVLPEWTTATARLHAISLGGREAPARVRVFRDFVRTELSAAIDRPS